MAPLSLKIVLDDGAVTRTMKFDAGTKVSTALAAVEEKMMMASTGKEYGLFLTSTDDFRTGIWLEGHKKLDFYILKDGDTIHYICRKQKLRVKMLDGTVKTLEVEHARPIQDIMLHICSHIGISNHDEYGLCRMTEDKPEETKPATGTLTLKRVTLAREKDAKLEQLSKKFKTDDHVNWLDQHRTLREQAVDPSETLLLKRRLYFSDRQVDTRDPVQLNLLYVQTRDAILDGRHPVTSEQAVEFAGIQCQVQYGDYQEDKHKSGFIENLLEFLPNQYVNKIGIEKKIYKQHEKHKGMEQLDAKYLYTKTAREMPTYGVTFFLVKEKQKGVKKLIPRLLGINASSILRLDEKTKEILQTWSLTQVKTFHVGATETFSLNFGDYSDKEYVVKTNEGYRIRDILQGYIDIIGKRLKVGPFGMDGDTGGQICQDDVQAQRANLMGVMTMNQQASKSVEHSFVGPSKIISVEQGKAISQGTHITTVQQLIVTDQTGTQHKALTTSVAMRSDMARDFVKKLNSLNSNSVKIVTYLTEPTEENVEKAKKIIELMQECKPDIVRGVRDAADKQINEEARKKLLLELDELCLYLNSIASCSTAKPFKSEDTIETAKSIADLSTQIYFSLDPRTKKRSDFVRRSRQSFIEDDKTRKSLHRASIIAASATTCASISEVMDTINQPLLNKTGLEPLNYLNDSLRMKIDTLNGSVALLLASHIDPKNIDYGAILTSMNQINEIMPSIAEDTQKIIYHSPKNANELKNDVMELCSVLHKMHLNIGSEDLKKIQDTAAIYTDVSERLTCKLGKVPQTHELFIKSQDVDDKASILLDNVAHLCKTSKDQTEEVAMLETAMKKCADAKDNFQFISKLAVPSIHEPHCQNALTSGVENLAVSVQGIAAASRPLVEDPGRRHLADDLRNKCLDLTKALDKLKDGYSNFGDTSDTDPEKQRLKFITTLSAFKNNIEEAKDKLHDSVPIFVGDEDDLVTEFSAKMASLNAATVALLAATRDPAKPDFEMMESSLNSIDQLLPSVVEDAKKLGTTKDDKSRKDFLDQIKSLCESLRQLVSTCTGSDGPEKLQDAATKYGDVSSKLIYTFGNVVDPQVEDKVITLAKNAADKTTDLLTSAEELTASAPNEPAASTLDAAGAQCADAAQHLLFTAQITAPIIYDKNCGQALTAAIEDLSDSAQQIVADSQMLTMKPSLQHFSKDISSRSLDLAQALDKLKSSYTDVKDPTTELKPDELVQKERERLKFITSLSASKDQIRDAEKNLYEPSPNVPIGDVNVLQHQYIEDVARLNAAVASLLAAAKDPLKPDYTTMNSAVNSIAQLMPVMVENTKKLGKTKNEQSRKELLQQMKALCDAARQVCASTGSDELEKMQEAATSFGDMSNKLIYTFGSGGNSKKEDEIITLAKNAGNKASLLLARAAALAASAAADPATSALDAAGARCANAARHLLVSAKLTAPTLHDPSCRRALNNAADELLSSGQLVVATSQPLTKDPSRQQLNENLHTLNKELADALAKLKKSCKTFAADSPNTKTEQQRELERAKYITTLNNAQTEIQQVENNINKPVSVTPLTPDTVNELKMKLTDSLAKLNAAIASLVAVSGGQHPDHKAAEEAVKVISEIIPAVVDDTKKLNINSDKDTKNLNVDDLRALCQAFSNICASGEDVERMNKASLELANASGKLRFTFNHSADKGKADQVKDLAESSCLKTSKMLGQVRQLIPAVSQEEGAYIDKKCAEVADAAKSLLNLAQITAPCISYQSCQNTLKNAVDDVSKSVNNVATTWKPLVKRNKQLENSLNKDKQDLEADLQKLKGICLEKPLTVPPPVPPVKRPPPAIPVRKTNAERTIDGTQEFLDNIRGELTRYVDVHQQQYCKGVAQLNAAVAALLAAARETNKPDKIAMETAVTSINKLIPVLSEDAKKLSSSKDDKSRQMLLDQTLALCDAARQVCASSASGEVEKLEEAATAFGNMSGKLVYKFGRGVDPKVEDEILSLAKNAADNTSKLVASATELAEAGKAEPAAGALHAVNAGCAKAARQLLLTAQIATPLIHDSSCQKALTAAAENLSKSAQQVAATSQMLTKGPSRQHISKNILGHGLKLAQALDELTNSYKNLKEPKKESKTDEAVDRKRDKLKFIRSLGAANEKISNAEKRLDQPTLPIVVEDINALQHQFSQDMADLNASIAGLLATIKDSLNPDYAKMETDVNSIAQLMPVIVDDTKKLSGTKNDETRQEMLEQTRQLCIAAKEVCSSSSAGNVAKSQEAASTFGDLSSKLIYSFGNGIDPDKEDEIISLAKNTGDKTSQLLARAAAQTASAAGSPAAGALDAAGARCADAARHLLLTTQLTTPSIQYVRCQRILTAAIDDLLKSAQHVTDTSNTLIKDPSHRKIGDSLQNLNKDLTDALAKLKKSYSNLADLETNKFGEEKAREGFKFTTAIQKARNDVRVAEQNIDKPTLTSVTGEAANDLKLKLTDSLAKLNAALAKLVVVSGKEHPQHKVAEEAVKTVSEIIPSVLDDVKILNIRNKDDQKISADELKSMCKAFDNICTSGADIKKLNEESLKLADASGKLQYTFNQRADKDKENKIKQLAQSSSEKSSMLLNHVKKLVPAVGRERGAHLDKGVAEVADAVRSLLQVAQITAPCISKEPCRKSLMDAVDGVSEPVKNIEKLWEPLVESNIPLKDILKKNKDELDTELQKIRKICLEKPLPPSVPTRSPPPVPQRSSSINQQRESQSTAENAHDLTQEFLDHLRNEELQNKQNELLKKAEEEKKLQAQFNRTVDRCNDSLLRTEELLIKISTEDNKRPGSSSLPLQDVQKQIEQHIARAAVAATELLTCNRPDSIDYTVASKSTDALSASMANIAKDVKLLSNSQGDKSRRTLLDSIKALCEASRRLCTHAKTDRQNLNAAAADFGDHTAKLIYLINPEIDSTQEKDVITRARAVGDCVSRLALGGATAAKNANDDTQDAICVAGRDCAGAAANLVYTAKIVAPLIQNPGCQNALAEASKDLTAQVKVYSTAFNPLSSDPQHASTVKQLTLEADTLNKLLQTLNEDLASGKLVKKKEVEKLIIEDTPLRQLAWDIYEDAKKKADNPNIPKEDKHIYVNYVKRAGEAIKAVDEANARCKNKPHDDNRRTQLENAILNLQHTLLMSRPKHELQSNIIDLAIFVKDVSVKAADLIDTTSKIKKLSSRSKKMLETIKTECHQINVNEFKLLKPHEPYSEQTAVDNIQDIDNFGQDCERRIMKIQACLMNLDDNSSRNILNEKASLLNESCNHLRFATKSGLATAKSAAIDEMMYDLISLEKRIDNLLAAKTGNKPEAVKNGASTNLLAARASLLSSARSTPAPALARYAASQRSAKDITKPGVMDKLKKHLKKLVHLLKSITFATGRRVATWQPLEGEDVAYITENLYEEIDLYEKEPNSESKQIISDDDYKRLLTSKHFKVQGDKKKLEERLQQLSTNMSSLTSNVVLSINKPETLSLNGTATVDCAIELVAIAKALLPEDPTLKIKSEETLEELIFVTYNFLKTAEFVSGDPNNSSNRQLLLDACGQVNETINKVGRCTGGGRVSRGCAEWARALRLAGALAAARSSPPPPPPYTQCLDSLTQHRDVIQNLREDARISPEEFGKSLGYVASAICNSSDYAAQCAYLISISDEYKDLAKEGMADVKRINKSAGAVQDVCSKILMQPDSEQVREDSAKLKNLAKDLQKLVTDNSPKIKDKIAKKQLVESGQEIVDAVNALNTVLKDNNASEEKITEATLGVLDAASMITVVTEHPSCTPKAGTMSAQTQQRFDDIVNNSKDLTNKMVTLIQQVKSQTSDKDDDDDETITWVMFDSARKSVLDAFDRLIKSVRDNGQFAGIIELQPAEEEEPDAVKKNYLQIQLDLANTWLRRPTNKVDIRSAGIEAVKSIVDIGDTMVADLKNPEKEEMQHVVTEVHRLLADLTKRYEPEKATLLMERLKELKKAIERGIVTMVVEELIDDQPPLEDLEYMVEAERDESKRKFILEKKIAELLDHLSRIKKTARRVAHTSTGTSDRDLRKCSEQTALLAPLLVKAAEERVKLPDNQSAVDQYRKVLAEYSQALSKIRELCDQSVDPMEFVQTAGETIQRIREEFDQHSDPQKCAYSSSSITKLANRAVHVGLSSSTARRDPELQRALFEAQLRLKQAIPAPGCRASKLPDWSTTTAEILRATNDVESVLGGENIFKKQPEPNQPIYNAALSLHATLREWSARDNDIVAVAKRMAVLMARLSDYMSAGKNHDVIASAKAIVAASHEVAQLAKKLALECTDIRIRTDLLQVCETIPTISGQLKMLTTVKGATLGQCTAEDKEAMDMLVGNAQNLMTSIENVVKSAAAASVKIRSQLGGHRMKWVRKTY